MGNLRREQIQESLPAGWRGSERGLSAVFGTGDFVAGTRFVNAISAAAEEADHHPDLLLTYPQVEVFTVSHDADAVTDRDLRLAAAISAIAERQGIDLLPDGETVLDGR